MRPLLFALSLMAVVAACGGGEPEAEATWETHTTDPDDDTSGGEESE